MKGKIGAVISALVIIGIIMGCFFCLEKVPAGYVEVQAEGDAEATRIRAEAQAQANREIAASLTPELIEKTKIDKWSGNMPTVMGESTPIIKIGE